MSNEPSITKKACIEYMRFIGSKQYHADKEDNYQNEIFQAALKEHIGPDVFTLINARMDELNA
jgi:hypothetical protein